MALASENYPEAIGHLIRRTLFDQDPEVSRAAGEALFSLVIEHPDVFERLVETALFDNDRSARGSALNLLLTGLNDKDVQVRRAAAEALVELGEVGAINVLVQTALFDADAEVRKAAAESLGKLDSARALDLLGEALSDEDPTVRRVAAQALGYLGDLAAIDPLLGAVLYDEDAGVRQAAALVLGSLKHSRALNLIVDELVPSQLNYEKDIVGAVCHEHPGWKSASRWRHEPYCVPLRAHGHVASGQSHPGHAVADNYG